MPEILGSLLAQINYGNLDPCPLGSGLSCVGAGGGTAYIRNLIIGPQGLQIAFVGILFGMSLFYGVLLIIGSRSESIISEVKVAYGQAVGAALLVGGALFLADTFASSTPRIVEPSPFHILAMNTIEFMSALIATAVIINITLQGIRLVIAMEDGDIDRAKKGFKQGIIGAAIAILAIPIVRTFTNVNTLDGVINPGGPQSLIIELIGIGRYFTLILGSLSVTGIIVAGIFLVISVDEGMKDKARKLIATSLIALVVALTSYGLVQMFLPDQLSTAFINVSNIIIS
ncbi:hypothetical protein HN512_03895 [Candidatus Peregrinibacteria bacterium]|jgi:hypothetical protein|nr:hypothetical protein [Candidatus Peregrinibacteria bacterium]MBT3598951.1 hypothetical protein [Candidatus Peregrinibacteria bacterium]MBT4367496.1 hypothetical protein [Candidatus Peregrinibacteria bacterium]MBT4585897.1 hypothetical protein [Candidatus Peregrinibacteria bacterium]MBT6731111.1 hypothetical protein [Candidatus Peregrinibacteria bacterium]